MPNRLRLREHDLAWSEVGEEVVLLDLNTSVYFSTQGTGSFLLARLAEGATEEELVDQLVAHYEVDVATARADTAAFLRQLEEKSLLERAEAPTPI